MKLPYKIIITLAMIGAVYFGYTKFFTSTTATIKYQTAVATQDTLITSVTASGQVAATNSRTVTTIASGVVKKVYVKEGQKVTTGTPILSIDLDMNGQQQLQQAYSSLLSAQNSLQSAKDKLYSLQSSLTNAQNIFVNQWSMQSSDDPTYIQRHNDYLSAQAAYTDQQSSIIQSQAALLNAQLNYQLASATVYAPISGTVSAISLTPGMILNPTSSAANSSNASNKIAIVKTDATPAITVSLSEVDVPKVKVGNKATITLDAYPGKTFTGKIIAVDTSGTISSNVVNYPTTIQFDTNADGILSNMSATVNIITNVDNDMILVPVAAVKSNVVQIFNTGKPVSVDVTTGNTDNTNIEILSGVNVGDTVVTSTSSSATKTTTTTTGTSIFGGATRVGGFGGGAPRGN